MGAAARVAAWPSVSFIVPLFNHLPQTQQMVDSLLAHMPAGLDHEIILTDDASTDGTPGWLATLSHPQIKTLQSKANRGYAANNNAAARRARGDVLALLNNDLLLQPGWLPPMLELLHSPQAKVGVVGNVQRRVSDGAIDHAGVALNASGQLVHISDGSVLAAGRSVRQATRLAVTGACMLLRAADFWACGGLDEQYRNGAEDVDLCFKLRQRGLRACVAVDSCVRHHVSLSRDRTSLDNERNSRLLFRRWRSLLKQELAALWLDLLLRGGPFPESPEALIDTTLLVTPHLASLRMAEALLVRQELRWQELLGNL
jgi:GT2 family glycosyltransferase